MKGACVSTFTRVRDGAVGREVTAPKEQPLMISIKPDDSMGSDVKHDKSVADNIYAHS